ncbi:MAG: hypothetical protein NVS2B7_39630 [Herpetosiphon sp.]
MPFVRIPWKAHLTLYDQAQGDYPADREDHVNRHLSWRLLCSTGAFTRHPDRADHHAIVTHGRDLPVDDFEVVFHAGWYPLADQIAADFGTSGLRFPALHAEKSIGGFLSNPDLGATEQALARLKENCSFARQIGAQLVIVHLWDLPGSDANLAHNVAALPACLDVASSFGLKLAVETIPCTHADPLSNIRKVMECDDRCLIALDTEFLAFHNQLLAAYTADWLWREGRVCHVHVKDYAGCLYTPDHVRRYLHPGEGTIDFVQLMNALRDHDFNGSLSLESSAVDREGTVDRARLQKSLVFLQHLIRGA